MGDKSRFSSPLKNRARELRQGITLAEQHVWELVRNRRVLGLKFRRQVPIDGFIVDFYCDELKLVVEVDGDVHGTLGQLKWDESRDAKLVKLGYRILRIPNDKAINDPDALLDMVRSLRPSLGAPEARRPLPWGEA